MVIKEIGFRFVIFPDEQSGNCWDCMAETQEVEQEVPASPVHISTSPQDTEDTQPQSAPKCCATGVWNIQLAISVCVCGCALNEHSFTCNADVIQIHINLH